MKPQSDQQILRYWVEIRELTSGSVRTLPLTAMRKISLARGKKNEPPPPSEDVLHIEDGAETLEAKTFDELRSQLRDKYPDTVFERTLHYERDREAEERRERALDGLMTLIAEAVVKKMIEEEGGGAVRDSSRHGRRVPASIKAGIVQPS